MPQSLPEGQSTSSAATEETPPLPVITSIDRNETVDPLHGTAYARLDGDQSKAIFERDGKTLIMHSFDNDPTFSFARYGYRDFTFSPSGRYVVFTGIGWEWGEQYVYDLQAERIVMKTSLVETWGITPDERRYWSCSSAGLSSASEVLIVRLPEGTTVRSVAAWTLGLPDDSYISEVTCVEKNGFIYADLVEYSTGSQPGPVKTHQYEVQLERGDLKEIGD